MRTRSRFRKVGGFLLPSVGMLALLASVFVAPANAESPEGHIIPGLVDSADLPGPAFVAGVITDVNGRPLPEGKTVLLQAWPSAEALSKLEIGESVKLAPVGVAETAKGGGFELRISDRDVLDSYLNADGLVDFEVIAYGERGVSVYNFPANPNELDASKDDARRAIEVKAVADIAPRFIDEKEPLEKVCTTYKDSNLSPAWVNVGYGYIAASNVTMKFTYTSGASSTLGVGTSTSGVADTFSASGTSSASSTATVSYPSTNSFKVWQTQFKYGKYATACTGVGVVVYEARADGFAGGSAVGTITGYPAASYCVSNVAGSAFTKSTTTAYTSSVGAGTSGFLGINLSARTGYSSTAKITFTFNAAAKLCGTNDYPGDAPSRLVAKP